MGPIAVFLIIAAVLTVLRELRRKKRGVEKQEEAPRWKWEMQRELVDEWPFDCPKPSCACLRCEGYYGPDEPPELPEKISL